MTLADLRLTLTYSLAVANIVMTLVVWFYYFGIWIRQRAEFEGAVPFHVVAIGISYLTFALLALERHDGWHGWLTLIAYGLATPSLAWVLYYERARFLRRVI